MVRYECRHIISMGIHTVVAIDDMGNIRRDSHWEDPDDAIDRIAELHRRDTDTMERELERELAEHGFDVRPGRDGGVAFKIRGYEIAWTSQRPNGSWCLVGLSSEDPFANAAIIATGLSDSRIEAMTHALSNIDLLKRAARVAVRSA